MQTGDEMTAALLMDKVASTLGHQLIEIHSRSIQVEIAQRQAEADRARIAELEQEVEDLRSDLEAAGLVTTTPEDGPEETPG
jgi:hypothetical protein